MTDEIKMFISDLIKILATAIGTLIVSRWKPKGEKQDATIDRQVKMIDMQGDTLADAFEQIRDLRAEIISVGEQLKMSNKFQGIQWRYIIELLEGYQAHRLQPPKPPKELESDPMIIRLINGDKNRPPV